MQGEVHALETELCVLDRTLRRHPEKATFHYSKYVVMCKLMKYQKATLENALKSIDDAIRLDPENSLYHSERGILYVQLGRFDEAKTCYEVATKLLPTVPVSDRTVTQMAMFYKIEDLKKLCLNI